MFSKPVRRVLIMLILLGLGYFAYDIGKAHTSQEVIVFKQYSSALMDNNLVQARNLVANEYGLKPFQMREKRVAALSGEIRFIWYSVRSQRISKDGKTASLRVRQNIRFDPPGRDSFWGDQVIVNEQHVTMVQKQSAWKIQDYRDTFYYPGMQE